MYKRQAQYNALRGRCYNCQETGHKRAECPYGSRGGGPGICPKCNLFHPAHVQCYARPIYAAAAEHDWRRDDEDMNACHMHDEYGRFVLPVCVNDIDVWALRDSGCGLEAIVHPDLVNQRDYTGDFVFCRGAFDNGTVTHRVPMATVQLLAPELNCLSPITVKAGVWNLPDVQCLLGNKLFARYPFLQDIVGGSEKSSRSAIKMSQFGHNGQNSNAPCHSVEPRAVRRETDTDGSDTVTAQEFDRTDRQKFNSGADTPASVGAVADHVTAESISEVPEDVMWYVRTGLKN